MLALVATLPMLALHTLDRPPVLNVPVYSLATIDSSGSTNMNILTYATPVGIRPERLWSISLFRGTRTHANFASCRAGVLQQLTEEHAPLIYTLGGTSGAAVDKARECARQGFVWEAAPECRGDERVLSGCYAYYRLEQVGELITAGEHDVAICRVTAILASEKWSRHPLSTAALRDAGLISDFGRAIPPEAC